MLVAIISCTQNKIQFYTTFLFKEDLNKGVVLWDNIIDTSKIYHFECELEVGYYTRPVYYYTRPVGYYTRPIGYYTRPVGYYTRPVCYLL